MEKENVFQMNNFCMPLYDSYETDGRKQFKIYVPGFKKEALTITFHEGVMNIKGNCDMFATESPDNGFWENIFIKNFDIDIPVGVNMFYDYSTLSNGILNVFFGLDDNKPKVLEINVQQPDSNMHPQLLNEDSDF